MESNVIIALLAVLSSFGGGTVAAILAAKSANKRIAIELAQLETDRLKSEEDAKTREDHLKKEISEALWARTKRHLDTLEAEVIELRETVRQLRDMLQGKEALLRKGAEEKARLLDKIEKLENGIL